MNLRERIAKMPAWKAAVIALFMMGMLMIGIEEVFISKVFGLMNHVINNMDKQFKDDVDDMTSDFKKFKEQEEYDKAESDIRSFEIYDHHISPHQDYVCGYEIINNKLEKYYGLAYIKHHDSVRQWVDKRIAQNKKFIQEQTSNGSFDPLKCKGKLS